MSNKPRPPHLVCGDRSEQLACNYLLKQGLHLIEKNFHCRHGELDLIMKDKNILVIIEVRYRKSNKYGGAVESISKKKQSRIIATTQYYLSHNKVDSLIRFDAVTMSNNSDINWIKNAFEA